MKQVVRRVLLVLCGVLFALSGASFVRAGLQRQEALDAGEAVAKGPTPVMLFAVGGMMLVLSVTLPFVLSRLKSRWD